MSDLINELKIIKKYYTEAEASNRVSIAEAQLDSVINLAKGLEQDITCTEVESRLRGDRIAELEAKNAELESDCRAWSVRCYAAEQGGEVFE